MKNQIIEYAFHIVNLKGESTDVEKTELVITEDKDGLYTLCNGFLNFLHSAGYEYVKDIQLGIDNTIDE